MNNLRRATLTKPSMPGRSSLRTLHMADGGNFLTRFIVGNTRLGQALTGRDAQIEQQTNPPPVPAPLPPPPPPNMGGAATPTNPAGIRFADGGGLRGAPYYKGSMDGGRVVGKGGPVADKIDAKYSDGEYVLPADTTAAVGVDKLNALRDATHTPAAVQQAYDFRGNPGGQNERAQEFPVDGQSRQGAGALGERAMGAVRGAGLRGVPGMGEPQRPAPDASAGRGLRLADGGIPGLDVNERPFLASDNARFGTTPGPVNPGNPNVGVGGSPEAQAFRASGAAANPTAVPEPVAPTPRATPFETGQKAASLLRNPVAQGALKVVGAANALGEGSDAVTDAQGGNYAGALDHGLRSAASVAATKAGPAGLLGAAYLGGTAVGDQIYSRLSPDTQDAIGAGVNGVVRGAGKLFGQNWGVDDSAMPGGVPATPAAAPTTLRAPTPAPAAPNPNGPGMNQVGYDADNARLSAQLQAQNPAPQTQPAADPTADAAAYTAQLAKNNAAADDLQAARLRLQPQFDAQNSVLSSPGAATIGTDASSLFARTPEQQAQDAKFDQGETNYRVQEALRHNPGLRGVAMANAIANAAQGPAALRTQENVANLNNQAANTRAVLENNTTLRGQTMSQQTAERGQDTSLLGHRMSNQVAVAQMQRDQFNKDRSYQMDVQKFGVEQANKNLAARQSSEKALQDEISGMIPPGPDGKPDTATASRYSVALNADLAAKQQVLSQRAAAGDTRAAAALADLQQHGAGALDPAYKRQFINGMKAKDLSDQYATGRLNPVGGTGVISDAPITSLRKTGNGFLGFGGEYTGVHADGTPGGTIPARAVEGDGSFFGGKRRNDLRSLIQP